MLQVHSLADEPEEKAHTTDDLDLLGEGDNSGVLNLEGVCSVCGVDQVRVTQL